MKITRLDRPRLGAVRQRGRPIMGIARIMPVASQIAEALDTVIAAADEETRLRANTC